MEDTLVAATSALSISTKYLSEHQRQSPVLLGDPDITCIEANQDKLTVPNLPPCPFSLAPYEDEGPQFVPTFKPSSSSLFPAAASDLVTGTLHDLERITGEGAKVVYRATAVLNDQKLVYEPGDSIALLCSNSSIDVDWLLSRVNIDPLTSADHPFTLQPTLNKPIPVWLLPGTPTSARLLLTHCCELHVPVTRRIIRLCAEYCSSDTKQAVRLRQLCSREYSELFDKYVRLQNVTLLDLLRSFPACRLPLVRLLEILPRLQPRPYTLISLPDDTNTKNCKQKEPEDQQLQFIFTRVDFSVKQNEPCVGLSRYPHRTRGVCTGWLERIWSLHAGSPIQLYLRRNLNGFRLPNDLEKPIIMIAAGTGLAPFISFMRKIRNLHAAVHTFDEPTLWLIFGCRSPNGLLFLEEVSNSVCDGLLHRWCLCFSRHSESFDSSASCCLHKDARYAQDCICSSVDEPLLTDHQMELADLVLRRKAQIMVCGEARAMAPAVRAAFARLLTKVLEKNSPVGCESHSSTLCGVKYVEKMRQDGRYLEDIWT